MHETDSYLTSIFVCVKRSQRIEYQIKWVIGFEETVDSRRIDPAECHMQGISKNQIPSILLFLCSRATQSFLTNSERWHKRWVKITKLLSGSKNEISQINCIPGEMRDDSRENEQQPFRFVKLL